MQNTNASNVDSLNLANGFNLALCQAGTFQGIGAVSYQSTLLRSARLPMFVDIRTPNGVQLLNYQLTEFQQDAAGTRLTFSAEQQAGGLMEWMVHSVRNRRNMADWSEVPAEAKGTMLEMHIRPLERTIAGMKAAGFSYEYIYRSSDLPIYKILDRGSWEPGGVAVGNTSWMRNCFTPVIVPITEVEQFHSTEWYIPDCANGNVFQFLPLQTELQGFTFTVHSSGILVTWANEVSHIRTLLEKPSGKNEIFHWHEHCGDLANEFATSPMEVLWIPGSFDKCQVYNIYEAVKELVHETLHSQVPMRRERVTTYGQIEEWQDSDLVRYRELGLPKLIEAGVKKINLASHFENNMNTYGVSNMCCTVDYKVAETVGEENLRAFCRQAQEADIKVEMWGNTSISALTEIFSRIHGSKKRINFLPYEGSVMKALEKSAEPFVRNPSNAIEADHYTPIFCVLNLRDPVVREYWMKSWGAAHDNIGLEGIFLDSSFNLSSDKFHWRNNIYSDVAGATADQTHLLGNYRPAKEPPSAIISQYRAHLELMAEMQQVGYDYCNEDLGVFGIHRHGPGVAARLDTLPLWTDCLCNFEPASIRKAGFDTFDIFFRGLAFRMMWIICWDIKNDMLTFNYFGTVSEDDRPTSAHLDLLKAFNMVEALLKNRDILADDKGVSYRAGNEEVIWAFKDFDYPLPSNCTITDVLDGKSETASLLHARKYRVYRIAAG